MNRHLVRVRIAGCGAASMWCRGSAAMVGEQAPGAGAHRGLRRCLQLVAKGGCGAVSIWWPRGAGMPAGVCSAAGCSSFWLPAETCAGSGAGSFWVPGDVQLDLVTRGRVEPRAGAHSGCPWARPRPLHACRRCGQWWRRWRGCARCNIMM